jgi:hypothetical protein
MYIILESIIISNDSWLVKTMDSLFGERGSNLKPTIV